MLSKKFSALLLVSTLIVADVVYAQTKETATIEKLETPKSNRRNGRFNKRKNKSDDSKQSVRVSTPGDEVLYDAGPEGSELRRLRHGANHSGNHAESLNDNCRSSRCARSHCGTCSTQQPPPAPLCKKTVEVEAPAELHEHKMYSWTCPTGFGKK